MSLEFISHSGAKAGQPNAHEVSGAAGRLLFDCGAGHRTPDYLEDMQAPDAVWISHAHGDHCGAVLDLVQRWPRVRLMATKRTAQLVRFALRAGGATPKKRAARIDAVCRKFVILPWRRFQPVPKMKGVRIMAIPAGHISGSAMAVVEFPVDGQKRRVLYTGDFCTHDQGVVKGAGIPRLPDDKPIDVVISEAILASDKNADQLVWADEAQALLDAVCNTSGPVLVGVSSLGESVEVAALLAKSGRPVMVDEYLHGVFDACADQLGKTYEQLLFGDRRRLAGALRADRIVVAPGDQYRRGTAAAELAGPLLQDPSATLVILNRARKKTGAGRLRAAADTGTLQWQGRSVELKANVIHRYLINHAPRWQLKGFIRGVDAPKNFLVHGTTGARWALKRSLQKDGFQRDIEVVDSGEFYIL